MVNRFISCRIDCRITVDSSISSDRPPSAEGASKAQLEMACILWPESFGEVEEGMRVEWPSDERSEFRDARGREGFDSEHINSQYQLILSQDTSKMDLRKPVKLKKPKAKAKAKAKGVH